MAKRGKGKLRAALANHTARSQQRAFEKKKEAEREHKSKKSPTNLPAPRRAIYPFLRDDTILLVGEGNFSFTLALLSAPHHHPPHLILATSYDTEDEVYQKYPDARGIVERIRQIAGDQAPRILAFGVDAGALNKCDAVVGPDKNHAHRWSKVWFGFPHVGAGHKDELRNVLANQLLILRFLISAAPFLTQGRPPKYVQGAKTRVEKRVNDDDEDEESDDGGYESDHEPSEMPAQDVYANVPQMFSPPARQGSVLITIRNASPYTLWNIPMLAKQIRSVVGSIAASAPALPKGVRPPSTADVDKYGAQYVVWRSFEFVPSAWHGYSHRRTIGFIDGLSTSNNEDLLRRPTQPKTKSLRSFGRHVGTGECRTYELALRSIH